jgi:hypothetical protein
MFTFGSQGQYEWLVTDEPFDLLQACPEIVLGKYIAITSSDSGPLVLTDKERAEGWESRGQIAYSPKVGTVEGLPRTDYDEWYIFRSPADLGTSHLGENIFEVPQEQGHLSVLVNYGFALHPPERADHLRSLHLFAEDFEDQIKELHHRHPDRPINRNLQPTPRLLSPTQQISDVFRRLLQGISQLLEMLHRSPHFVQGPRHRQRPFAQLLSIAQVELSPARSPPRSPRPAVIHPLPDLRIRTRPQQLHQR